MARMGKMGRSNLARTATALREDSRLGKFLPSALTLLGLCSGATAIWFALGGDWKAGVAAIICAAVSAATPASRSPERGGVALARRSRRSPKTYVVASMAWR